MTAQGLSKTLAKEVSNLRHFGSGQIGEIYRAAVEGREVVIKTASRDSRDLLTEANMLYDLAQNGLRVPEVIGCTSEALVLEYIEENPHPLYGKETQAAKALASLHAVSNESRMYGYYYDTTIASFPQKNEQTQYNWGLFLAHMRILPMAKICYDKGVLDKPLVARLETLCTGIYKRVDMSLITPSLLHGDVWSGNVIFEEKGVCFIDPAIYFGDREMELAFIVLFDTFGKAFFDEYTKVHPLSDDFHEVKVPLYQIYPLLVHAALYGSTYVRELEERLQRLKV